MIGTVLRNKPRQYFGFAYSPDGMNLPPELLSTFHKQTGEYGNGVAWLNQFTNYRTGDFLPAGAYVFGTSANSGDEARESVWPSASGLSSVFSLWYGIGTGARLPPGSFLTKVFSKTDGACRFDVQNLAMGDQTPRCASPDLDFVNGEWATVCLDSNSTSLPLTGTPTRRVQSSTTATPVGTTFAKFKPKYRAVNVSTIALAASALGQYMTGVRVDPGTVEPGIQANTTQGNFPVWNAMSRDDGLATSWNAIDQRLLVIDAIVPDSATPIDQTQAASVFEKLGDDLPLLGLPGRQFWTFDRPVVSEILDTEFSVDANGNTSGTKSALFAYTMKVFRKINGTPWLDCYLTAWVHKSGQIMRLEVTGMDIDSSGEAGVEISALPVIVRQLSIATARGAVKSWLSSRNYETDTEVADAVAYTFTEDRRFVIPKYFSGVDLRTVIQNGGSTAELLSGARLLALDLGSPEGLVSVVH